MEYKIALFLHITGALLLVAAMSLEWLGVFNLRKSDSAENIRESIKLYSTISKAGGVSMILILFPGIYMMSAWRDNASWIIIGFVGLILLGAIGGIITGRKMRGLKKMLSGNKVESIIIKSGLPINSFLFSIKIRTMILFGVVFMMSVKPDMIGSLITLAVAILLGIIPLRSKSGEKALNKTSTKTE